MVINHTRYYNIEPALISSASRLRAKSKDRFQTVQRNMDSSGAIVIAESTFDGKRVATDESRLSEKFYQEFEITIYEPPCLMKKTFFKHVKNCSIANEANKLCGDIVFLVLFEEYGNLFRDCDNLECNQPFFKLI